MKKALTIPKKDYNKFLKHTNRVNLQLQQALKNGGISFELRIDSTDDNCLIQEREDSKMFLSVALSRKDKKNYVKIKGKEYRVKSMPSLFELNRKVDSTKYCYSGGGYLQRTIRLLYKAIDGITHKEIGQIIKEGKREYKKMMSKQEAERQVILKRSIEFKEHAIRLTRAIAVQGGYIVKGLSGMHYFIEKENAHAYTTKNKKKDKYLCLVDVNEKDEAEGQAGINDQIARRMLMLSKDEKVAKEIWERGDHQDKWWLEISKEKIEVEI